MDYLTEIPTGAAPADIVDRFLRLAGAVEVDPLDTIGARRGWDRPSRVARVATGAYPWPDAYDAFSDYGFRSHPATDDFPGVVNLCALTTDGDAVVITCCEGDLSISVHETVAQACVWMGAEGTTDASRHAFQLDG